MPHCYDYTRELRALNARIESIFRLTLRDFGRVHKLFHCDIYTMKCNRFRVDYDVSERFIVSASRFNNLRRKFIRFFREFDYRT